MSILPSKTTKLEVVDADGNRTDITHMIAGEPTLEQQVDHRSIPIPPRLDERPRNDAGYVVPWFVGEVDGKPDFRTIKPGAVRDAVRFQWCWLCGLPLGGNVAFLIGPMCAINRVSPEPPSHRDCAEYAARACPFLANPARRRRKSQMPDHEDPAGLMIERNPGVALVWVTKATAWHAFRADNRGYLFDVGDPVETSWWARSRPATTDEVIASIESGYPILLKTAEEEGPRAVALLESMRETAMDLIP